MRPSGGRLTSISVALAVSALLCGRWPSPTEAATALEPAAAATPKPGAKAGSGSTTRRAKAKAAPAPPPSKPDRALYLAAESLAKRLRGSRRLMSRLLEWDRVAGAYRLVVHKYPRSPYCDDSLLKAGDLQREMATRFKSPKYTDRALDSYALVVSEYPGSSLGEAALFNTFEILTERKAASEARAAAKKYLAAYPDGKRAGIVGKAVTASTPAKGTVQVFGVRFWSGEASTRVVIDMERTVEIKQDRLQSPPRLFVDLIGTRLHPDLETKTFPVGNAFLKQIRIGINRENVVRVVIDFEEATGHNVFFLEDPARLVIDIKGDPRKSVRIAGASEPRAPTPGSEAPAAEPMETVEVTQPTPVLPEAALDPAAPSPSPLSETPQPPSPASGGAPPAQVASAGPAPSPVPTPAKAPTPAPTPIRPQPPSAAPTPTATPAPPSTNRDGSYSLARQLGLGATRICLDAGHGGHDPGAIGRGRTQEKDITLAVVLKLEKLIRTRLGADVVLTRDRDVFIPLEERTAIANSSGADMFLSVHINSARNRTGRGLETYYLSFAKSAAAEELAARENAISQATMKDLNNLVKAIATNSKIDESRDFAGIVQKNNVSGLSPSFKGVLDRGVHTAPFYVLIGANMPSILTEVGFISHPEEERWLRSDKYQDKLAESLLEGVRSYLNQLNRTQATRLDGREGVRVPVRGRSKH